MDSNRYSYLWENNDNVLVKSKYGYSIVDRKKCKMFLIENEKIEAEIIQNMLRNGRPIYKSIEELKNNASPINIIGQPSEHEDFSIKRYKLSVRWLKNIPLSIQIKNLKVAFPIVNTISNQELLNIAKNYEEWCFDTVYLDKFERNKLLKIGQEKQLKIIIQLDDLKEFF